MRTIHDVREPDVVHVQGHVGHDVGHDVVVTLCLTWIYTTTSESSSMIPTCVQCVALSLSEELRRRAWGYDPRLP